MDWFAPLFRIEWLAIPWFSLATTRQMLENFFHFQNSLQSSYDSIIYNQSSWKKSLNPFVSKVHSNVKGGVSKSFFLDYTDPADRSSKLLGNVGSHLRIDTTSYLTRLASPPTTLPEPHILQRQYVKVPIAQAVSLSIPLPGYIRNHTIREITPYLLCVWEYRSNTSLTTPSRPYCKRISAW